MSHYIKLLERLQTIDPVAYAKSRNYTDGAVTKLSAYIARGVIDTRMVLDTLIARGYRFQDLMGFAQQLAWRDYFQQVWQMQGDGLNCDLRGEQQGVRHHMLPTAIAEGSTGIDVIDQSIHSLIETGYMHNHVRMYTAFLAGNLAGSHWRQPAQWMYYHLLDGDWGSNALSWQWVVGTFSNKKYIANQENINRYTGSKQIGTYLDCSYEALADLNTPEVLIGVESFEGKTPLPSPPPLVLIPHLPVFVYNYYHLSPTWRANEQANRILLLEPNLFDQYPVSGRCIDFVLELAKDIPGLQVFVGSFQDLEKAAGAAEIVYREHPLNKHYHGKEDSRAWLVDGLEGSFPSFFSYWKQVERKLRKEFSGK